MDPLTFASAAPGDEQTRTVAGRFEAGAPDWAYVSVSVPPGVREIAVTSAYDRPEPPEGRPGNALDLGAFDEAGFRGWSGGARDSFTISRTEATPGYLPGPVTPGVWQVALGPYTVAPQGMNWTVTVTLRFGEPGPAFVPAHAPTRARGRGRAWYRGDMHLHSVHSDGAWLPEQVVATARRSGLDYIVSTEHNTSSAAGVWGHHAREDLLIIDGEEVTTRNGHYTALGLPPGTWIDWRHRAADGELPRFLREIHRHGALAVAAHPFAPFAGGRWKFGYDEVDAIEVWNGPWTPDDETALQMWDGLLAEGRRWIPAVGDSDSHREGQVIGLPQNVVLADDLERGAILSAVRAGRLYVAESSAVSLSFEAAAGPRSAGVGGRLEAGPGEEVTVSVATEGVPAGVIRLFTDEGQMFEGPVGTAAWRTTPRVSTYVRAEVRHPDGSMAALTNPIFLGH
ncbi:CehA/McbA family metallohydrolase [Actinomadura sp. DC4]|uniref:CehA/McbA family metallohydrolase n=1 Tax=Actinomadura sp. DC4 TaxID=3055069 RepID=UPI0025AF7774|nr:CehA/McbA family metallohydrolase [Actinomadura sp. DC4]MDN3358882.1 CehA/McbA family metallohydrolase [Actinomadura sp. DC4]